MRFRKLAAALAVVASATGMATVAAAPASAAPCGGTYTLGVGGVGNGGSNGFAVVQPVGYSAQPFAFSVDQGVRELDRLFHAQRRLCGAQHVKVIGHSNGAAVVSTWFQQAHRANTNGILIGNPKRINTGISQITGLPNGGTNIDYKGAPVLDICQRRDPICNYPAGPNGYFDGTHSAYQFNVNTYSDNGNGLVWIG